MEIVEANIRYIDKKYNDLFSSSTYLSKDQLKQLENLIQCFEYLCRILDKMKFNKKVDEEIERRKKL